MCCGFNNEANEARNFVELNDNGCSRQNVAAAAVDAAAPEAVDA